MSHALLQKLVSQSESEGVTLAEIISRTLTASQIEEVQRELEDELSEGYESISGFMSEVEVQPLEDIMEASDLQHMVLARVAD